MFWDAGGLALDAVAGWRVRELPHGALLLGAGIAWQGHFLEGEKCLISPVGIGPSCEDHFSLFWSVTALGGVEGTFGVTLRVLAGPEVFLGASSRPAAGLQGRADLSTPSIVRMALVFSTRGAIIPSFDGDQYQLGAIGAGIRIR